MHNSPTCDSPEVIPTTSHNIPTESPHHVDKSKSPPPLPSPPHPQTDIAIPSWFQHNTKLSIKLPNTTSFSLGTIYFQNQFYYFHPLHGNSKYPLSLVTIQSLFQQSQILRGNNHPLTKSLTASEPIPKHVLSLNELSVPLRTEDEPLSSWPRNCSFTYNQSCETFGFRNLQKLLPQLKHTCQNNFTISNSDSEPIIDLGSVSTIKTPSRNRTPLKLPHHFGDMFHCDIVYGSETDYEEVRYALLMVDRATRYKLVYPLTNLTDDITNALEKFYSTFKLFPKVLRSDYDKKLIGSKIESFIKKHNLQCQLQGVPPETQNKNGLSESNWKYLLQMCRA